MIRHNIINNDSFFKFHSINQILGISSHDVK